MNELGYMKHSPERRLLFDRTYIKMAETFAELSYAERKKVGAIIVSENDQIISQGFNGTVPGFPNVCEGEDGKTTWDVLHAETNAISKCARYGNSTNNATLYVTLSPCPNCAKTIVQAGIKRVVYTRTYKDISGLEFLKQCGIEVVHLNSEEQ